MRYFLLLIAAFACSTPKGQEYIPNKEAVELNNQALDLMMKDPFARTVDTATYEQAIELLNSALKLDKRNSIIYSNRHDAFVKLGRYDDALETLKMATSNIEHFAEGFMGLGMLYEHLNEPKLARKNFNSAIENFKLRGEDGNREQRIHANCEIAFAKAYLTDKQDALDELNALLAEHPNNQEIQMYIELLRTFDKDKFIAERFGRL
jgi:tetratricopeptide (TPR) repeat protein